MYPHVHKKGRRPREHGSLIRVTQLVVAELVPNLDLPPRPLQRHRSESRERKRGVDTHVHSKRFTSRNRGPVNLKSERQPITLEAEAEADTSLEAEFLWQKTSVWLLSALN